MKTIIKIETGSEAFTHLRQIMTEESITDTVRLEWRPDGVAIKVDENVWSHTLNCKAVS